MLIAPHRALGKPTPTKQHNNIDRDRTLVPCSAVFVLHHEGYSGSAYSCPFPAFYYIHVPQAPPSMSPRCGECSHVTMSGSLHSPPPLRTEHDPSTMAPGCAACQPQLLSTPLEQLHGFGDMLPDFQQPAVSTSSFSLIPAAVSAPSVSLVQDAMTDFIQSPPSSPRPYAFVWPTDASSPFMARHADFNEPPTEQLEPSNHCFRDSSPEYSVASATIAASARADSPPSIAYGLSGYAEPVSDRLLNVLSESLSADSNLSAARLVEARSPPPPQLIQSTSGSSSSTHEIRVDPKYQNLDARITTCMEDKSLTTKEERSCPASLTDAAFASGPETSSIVSRAAYLSQLLQVTHDIRTLCRLAPPQPARRLTISNGLNTSSTPHMPKLQVRNVVFIPALAHRGPLTGRKTTPCNFGPPKAVRTSSTKFCTC